MVPTPMQAFAYPNHPRGFNYEKSNIGDGGDLISNETFCMTSLPSSVPSSSDHEAAGRVDIQGGDYTRPRGSRNDDEGNLGMFESALGLEVIETEDIV